MTKIINGMNVIADAIVVSHSHNPQSDELNVANKCKNSMLS